MTGSGPTIEDGEYEQSSAGIRLMARTLDHRIPARDGFGAIHTQQTNDSNRPSDRTPSKILPGQCRRQRSVRRYPSGRERVFASRKVRDERITDHLPRESSGWVVTDHPSKNGHEAGLVEPRVAEECLTHVNSPVPWSELCTSSISTFRPHTSSPSSSLISKCLHGSASNFSLPGLKAAVPPAPTPANDPGASALPPPPTAEDNVAGLLVVEREEPAAEKIDTWTRQLIGMASEGVESVNGIQPTRHRREGNDRRGEKNEGTPHGRDVESSTSESYAWVNTRRERKVNHPGQPTTLVRVTTGLHPRFSKRLNT